MSVATTIIHAAPHRQLPISPQAAASAILTRSLLRRSFRIEQIEVELGRIGEDD